VSLHGDQRVNLEDLRDFHTEQLIMAWKVHYPAVKLANTLKIHLVYLLHLCRLQCSDNYQVHRRQENVEKLNSKLHLPRHCMRHGLYLGSINITREALH
jgi:hypothetical protein